MQEPRRGRPLSPLSSKLGPEMTEWATRLREFYTSLDMTLSGLEELIGVDATTLSRYLNGLRLPEISFLKKLDDAVYAKTQARMQPAVMDSVRTLYLAACQVHEPQRHEVYTLRDALKEAEERARLAEETVWDLQAELKAEQRRRQLVETGLRQLQARVDAAGDIDALRMEFAQAIAERDQLNALLQQHAAELATALQDQYALIQARSEIANALQTAEQALNDKLERQWATEPPMTTPPPRLPPKKRRKGRRTRVSTASLDTLLEGTQKAARDLPSLVRRLAKSDPWDVEVPLPTVGIPADDELGSVAAAIDDVLRLAAEQALMRETVNEVFARLSDRSNALIQRQLLLLSELQRRTVDPEGLSHLFKLDHLATRMRRHGESLLVLAGEEPRHWTRPVPLVDVLRAAASEVEQYERINLTPVPPTELVGRVVNDLVHLLAELLENATTFSAPQTLVRVTGHVLPDGWVLIEIHDSGVGISPDALLDINQRLADPPMFDVNVAHRVGVFVVGRLSQPHGIRIQLQPSDSGGITASVMLPADVWAANPSSSQTSADVAGS